MLKEIYLYSIFYTIKLFTFLLFCQRSCCHAHRSSCIKQFLLQYWTATWTALHGPNLSWCLTQKWCSLRNIPLSVADTLIDLQHEFQRPVWASIHWWWFKTLSFWEIVKHVTIPEMINTCPVSSFVNGGRGALNLCRWCFVVRHQHI